MNKQLLHFLSVIGLTITLFACKKEDSNSPGNNNNANTDKSEFIINGIADVTFTEGIGALGLEIQHVSGSQKTVNLSMSTLPAGVSASFSSPSGTPTFGSAVVFNTTGESDGVHTATLHATNGSTSKDYEFKLHLPKADDCTGEVTSPYRYSGTEPCGMPGKHFTVYIYPDPEHFNRVVFQVDQREWADDPEARAYSFYGDLNCFGAKIIIPAQTTSDGVEIVDGIGSFRRADWPKIQVEYTTKDESGNLSSCVLNIPGY